MRKHSVLTFYRSAVACSLLLTALATTGARAQSAPPGDELPRGEVAPQVSSLTDSSQSYALYLPAAYVSERTWPVIFVMDPRGRAVVALELFRQAAERFGWIVLSSYGTRSDTDEDPNTPAFKAMLSDAQQRFAVDTRRLYLAGMSGTAKVSWPFGRMLEGSVAGVIGVGGGMPPTMPLGESVPFAFYGIAGSRDFNYREMRELDQALDKIGALHRFAVFEGPHGWAPKEACAEAVAWMELAAMRQGLAPVRESFVEERFAADFEAARATRESGDLLDAYERFDQLVRDFDGLRDTATVRAAAAALDGDSAVRAARDEERKLLKAESAYRERIQRWLDRMAMGAKPLQAKRSLAELQVPKLREAAASEHRRMALSAQRRLETAFVQANFYLPQAYRARDQLDHVVAVLKVAAEIKPDSARPRWSLASLFAELGQIDEAFDALRAAADRGRVDIERLKTDSQWLPLHDDPRWATWVADLSSVR